MDINTHQPNHERRYINEKLCLLVNDFDHIENTIYLDYFLKIVQKDPIAITFKQEIDSINYMYPNYLPKTFLNYISLEENLYQDIISKYNSIHSIEFLQKFWLLFFNLFPLVKGIGKYLIEEDSENFFLTTLKERIYTSFHNTYFDNLDNSEFIQKILISQRQYEAILSGNFNEIIYFALQKIGVFNSSRFKLNNFPQKIPVTQLGKIVWETIGRFFEVINEI